MTTGFYEGEQRDEPLPDVEPVLIEPDLTEEALAKVIGGADGRAYAGRQFRQHKANPTQIPIGTPPALVAVGGLIIGISSAK
jgi:hypothetical protein